MDKRIREKLKVESNELFNMDDRLDNVLDKIEFKEEKIKKSFNFNYVLYPVLLMLLCFTSAISLRNLTISNSSNSVSNSTNSNIILTKPKTFDEADYFYDFNSEIPLDRGEVIYLKIRVGVGMVVSNIQDIDLELYDSNQEFITKSIGDELGNPYNEFEAFLPIEEEGLYYIVIKHWSFVDSNLRLKYYSYNDVIQHEGIDLTNISSYEGEIEGKYDFEKFICKTSLLMNNTIRIKNTGNSNMYVYFEKFLYKPVLEKIAPNEIKYIGIYDYVTNVFVCNDFRNREDVDGYKYSMDIEFININFAGEIYESDIPSRIHFDEFQNINYHTFLKKGAYSFNVIDDYYNDLKVDIYNDKTEKLDANIVNYLDCYDRELAANFVIHEDGYYYVSLDNSISIPRDYSFNYYNYETLFDRDNPFILDVSGVNFNSGELEGSNDFECYSINNVTDSVKVYCLKNESPHAIKLILSRHIYADMRQVKIEPNEYIIFPVYPGKKEIIVSNNYSLRDQYEYSDYSFSVFEIENNNKSKYSKDIEYITEEYSDDYYLVGYDVSEAYFKLKIEEECWLTFEYEKYYDSSCYPQFILEDQYNNTINYKNIIQPGEYYVRVVANSHVFNKIKVKYTKHV